MTNYAKYISNTEKLFLSSRFHYKIDPFLGLVSLKLYKKLDSKILEDAQQRVLSQHQAFQYLFSVEEGKSVKRKSLMPTSYINIKEFSGEKAYKQFLSKFLSSGVDFNHGPLHEMVYCQVGSNYFIAFKFHHIIFDAKGLSQFLNQLMQVYKVLSEGKKYNQITSDEKIYNEYIVAIQKKEKENSELKHNYWKAYLDNVKNPKGLDRGTKKVNTQKKYSYTLPLKVSEQILKKAKSNGVSLFFILLAIYYKSLSTLFSQNDLILRISLSQGDSPSFLKYKEIIGSFSYSFPLRLNYADLDLLTLSKKIKVNFTNCLAHLPVSSFPSISLNQGKVVLYNSLPFAFSYVYYKGSEFVQSVDLSWNASPVELSLFCIINKEVSLDWHYDSVFISEKKIKNLIKDIEQYISTFLKVPESHV